MYTTELPRRTGLGRLAVGCLAAAGFALAAFSPAMADNDWNNGHGNKHWKHRHGGYYQQSYYYYAPPPPPVYYYQPAPVYYAPPPPPPVYYYPYQRPQISIVFPFNFD